MPVLSPHRSTASSGLTGTYRSAGGYTSSLEGGRSSYGGGYGSAYGAPRISTYTSERYTSRSYADSSGRSYYSRAGSITEDGYTSRFREESTREPSVRRDSSRMLDNLVLDTPTRRSLSSASDLLSSTPTSSSRASSISVVDSIADLRNKYSASNYVPAVIRNRDTSRTRSSVDIGLPPLKVNAEPNRNHVTVCAASTTTTTTTTTTTAATNNSTTPTNKLRNVDVDNAMRPRGDTCDASATTTTTTSINTKISTSKTAAGATVVDGNSDTNGNHQLAAVTVVTAPPAAAGGSVSVLEMTRKFERRACAATTSSSATQTTRTTVGRRLAGGGGGGAGGGGGSGGGGGGVGVASVGTANGGGAAAVTTATVVGEGVLPRADGALAVTQLAAKKGKTSIVSVPALNVVGVTTIVTPTMGVLTSPTKATKAGVLNGRHHVNDFSSYIPMDCSSASDDKPVTTNGVKSHENGDCLKANKKSTKDVNCTSPRLNRSPIASNGSSNGGGGALGGSSSGRNSLERDGAHARGVGGGGAAAGVDSIGNSSGGGGGGGGAAGAYDRASPVKQMGLNGLKNIGNTCFMNSVVQCLSNTRPLLEYVKKDGYAADINTTLSSMKGALIKAFAQVIKELWSEDCSDRVVNTVSLKSQIQRFAPRFMGYSQQDAQEFLRYLLEGLHEDVNRVTSKPAPIHTEIDEKLSDNEKAIESWQRYLRRDNSKIVDLFVGQFKSTLRCTHCGHCSVTFDPFWDLSLPIPQKTGAIRLSQCLDAFTREETLDGDEKPTCSKCRERRKCTKSFTIHKFPKILVIHLKRFSPTERFRGKLSVTVDFPFEGLDMSGYASESSNLQCRYNLYAVSNHSGTTYSGHYTAYCRHPYSQSWHEYNDSRVSSISSKSVVSGEAYVLFYEQDGKVSAHL